MSVVPVLADALVVGIDSTGEAERAEGVRDLLLVVPAVELAIVDVSSTEARAFVLALLSDFLRNKLGLLLLAILGVVLPFISRAPKDLLFVGEDELFDEVPADAAAVVALAVSSRYVA